MDGNGSYPLVPFPPEQGVLVPVSTALVAEVDTQDHAEADLLALLWQCLCQLAFLFWLAVLTIRHLQRQLVELRCQANYWRAQHQRAVERAAALAAQVRHLQAEIRELQRRLFARKSETSATTQPKIVKKTDPSKPRSRGQQPGRPGHGRRHHDHLPTSHETCAVPDAQQCCPECGQAYEEIPGTADGDILEVEVRAHRRRYHRKRYHRRCACANQPTLLTAPPPDKLIPKNNLGISVWTLILQRKFEFFQPLYRVLADLRSHDLDLPAGTITDGLQKLVPLFEPLYALLVEHNRAADHWHCDETRWLVFEKQADKAGFAWMLWVFAAKESIVFVLDPTRSHDVPEKHFGDDAEGIANVDRYSAYKAMAQVKAGQIILAFCWAHVRRDFLTVLTGWSELIDWAWSWLEDIGLLYHRNDQRLAVQEDAGTCAEADQRLRAQVEHLRQRCETELAEPSLRQPQRKVLTSLQEHWSGLTVFVDHPEVPMDNNEAERRVRGPVVARKNFYGSGALWSGRLAAMLFSLFQTLQAWGLVVAKWLTAYLTACAQAKGKPPPDPQRYLPWNMTPEEQEPFRPTKPKPAGPPGSNPDTTTAA
ncbi:MAG TPA: IS66 family transposase [Anaerolineales bacterium]